MLALQAERFGRGFGGHEELSRTGFVHMNGRVYDPRLGRFLQPDPVVAAPGSGQGYNRYAYVLNRPLSLADPTGLTPVPPGAMALGMAPVDIDALILGELWDYIGWADLPVYELTGFDSIMARGLRQRGVRLNFLTSGRRSESGGPCGSRGELIVPDMGHSSSADADEVIITNGIRDDPRLGLDDGVTASSTCSGTTTGFQRSHCATLLQAIFQKMLPSADWMGRLHLASNIATRTDRVNAVRRSMRGHADGRERLRAGRTAT